MNRKYQRKKEKEEEEELFDWLFREFMNTVRGNNH